MRLQESMKVFPLWGRDIHKTQANVELIPTLALHFVIPEHLSLDVPLALAS
jgi:cytochrome c